MASSSSPPHRLPDPNPNSVASFFPTPLLKPNHPALLAEKTKRRRQRALRMSREKQIPALALHCASQFPPKRCFIGNPHSSVKDEDVCLNEVCKTRLFSRFQETSAPPCNGSAGGGGLVIYDGRLLKNRGLEDLHFFSDRSSGDGDVSDVGSNRGPDLFELRNWQNRSLSSPSSSYEGPLNVTRAASECSSDEHTGSAFDILNNGSSLKIDDDGNGGQGHGMKDDLTAEYWKLQADVLTAECNLLRVEKELALRRWKQAGAQNDAANQVFKGGRKKNYLSENASRLGSLTKHSSYEDRAKEGSQDTFDKLHDTTYSASCFAREAFRKLDKISNRSSWGRVPVEDPSEALQERLQKLLVTVQCPVLEQGSQMQSLRDLRFYDNWDKADMLGVRARTIDKRVTTDSMLENRCYAESCTSRKERGDTSLEFLETQAAAAFIRGEYRSILSDGGLLSERTCEQMLGEEMYCKVAIRQMVAQMQAESEQWSQVQEILLSLQEEMRILIKARELWEERARQAEAELLSSKNMAHDWRCRAESAEEEVALLRSERQALKTKIHNLKQKHAVERRRWNEASSSRANEGVSLPRPDSQLSIGVACEVEDQPRHASVGTQEDYALCEVIVHSRNESSRSSVDIAATSQRGIQKSIKKSPDFSNSSNDSNISKPRVRSHRFGDQILKIEPTRLDFCSKASDVNKKASLKLSGPLPKVELMRLECVEPLNTHEHKERKKARLFTWKENYSKSGPIDTQVSFFAEHYLQKPPSLGQALSAGQDSTEPIILWKPKSSVPSAPTSTPSRLPFAEIFNSPASR